MHDASWRLVFIKHLCKCCPRLTYLVWDKYIHSCLALFLTSKILQEQHSVRTNLIKKLFPTNCPSLRGFLLGIGTMLKYLSGNISRNRPNSRIIHNSLFQCSIVKKLPSQKWQLYILMPIWQQILIYKNDNDSDDLANCYRDFCSNESKAVSANFFTFGRFGRQRF